MVAFINNRFMLQNKTAETLYHKYAEDMPIFDYHSHLKANDILSNRNFLNLAEVWLKNDHYKWRLLRAVGVDEKNITGDGDDYENFLLWAEIVEKCIGNPIYHWTHLELKNYFGIEEMLTRETAPMIWERCSRMLSEEKFRTVSLFRKSKVTGFCTTDDPVDSLQNHAELGMDRELGFQVLPTFRPDKALNLDQEDFGDWLIKLEKTSGIKIEVLEDFEEALKNRCGFFKQRGCLSADHSIEVVDFTVQDIKLAKAAFAKARENKDISKLEKMAYQTEIMLFLGRMYHEMNLVMQLHLGAARNLRYSMEPDSGFDSMGDPISVRLLAPLFSRLVASGQLPKTIIFSSNPTDNKKLISLANCFNGGGVPGKLQTGSAWWFADHRDGIEEQLRAISNQGMLSTYVGMTADSRSLLSMSRHDYFRRILCNLLGKWVEDREIPSNEVLLGGLVQDICYNNAIRYFEFKEIH